MKQTGLVFILFFVSISVAGNVLADDVIKSAMTAASISVKTTVMDWNFKTMDLG